MSEQTKLLEPIDIISRIGTDLATKMSWQVWGYHANKLNSPLSSVPVVERDEQGVYHATLCHEGERAGVTRISVREVDHVFLFSVADQYGVLDKLGEGCTCAVDRLVARKTAQR